MPRKRRKGGESSPTWALRPNHVYQILQIISDYWSDHWMVERIDICPPVQRKDDPSAKDLKAVVRQDRADALRESDHYSEDNGSWVLTTTQRLYIGGGEPSSSPEFRFWSAYLKRAIKDYLVGSLSPHTADQRMALNAYWWLQGYPCIMPVGLDQSAIAKIALDSGSSFRLRHDEDPFDRTNLSDRSALWRELDDPVPYFPEGMKALRCESEDMIAASSMSTTCAILGLDASAVRKYIHLLDPDWEPTSEDSDDRGVS